MTVYRVGTFNLEYGRKIGVVHDEVQIALMQNDLDILILQEAADYFHDLSRIGKYNYYCGNSSVSHRQVGILVKETHHVTGFKALQAGDGWTTISGAKHGPVATPQLRVNGELGIKGLHLPTPSLWVKGKLTGPAERIDDLKETMAQVMNWLRPVVDDRPSLPKIAAGDWNESPKTKGAYSPAWVASQTGAQIHTTDEKSPHGNIDYFMVKGKVKIRNVYQDDKLKEKSDHELRVLVCEV